MSKIKLSALGLKEYFADQTFTTDDYNCPNCRHNFNALLINDLVGWCQPQEFNDDYLAVIQCHECRELYRIHIESNNNGIGRFIEHCKRWLNK